MPLHIHRPSERLSSYVEVMCVSDDYHPSHRLERILPDGRMTLAIRLDSEKLRIYEPDGASGFKSLPGSLVSGAHSRFHVIDTECQKSILTIHFKPGGAFPFFAVPVDELANRQTPLSELWGREGEWIREQLANAIFPSERFKIAESALLRRLDGANGQNRAVRFALNELENIPLSGDMSELSRRTGMSQRRFIELFRTEVGLTPKVFSRVRRFHQVLKRLQSPLRAEWADVAFTCGFYDQAHFIHEFQAFCGLSPVKYLANRGEHLLHLPVR